ncbi:CBS domain-containing protein [Actinomadura viridis]|uniref:CBS domain-containing protein n=1 Tax=Actinomadura viridis TaxID=58110 RepID=UPI00367BFC4E
MQRRMVAHVMTRNVVTVTEDTPFAEIVEALAEHDIRAVPVIDEDRRVLGVVSDADLLRKEEYRDAGEGRTLFEGRRRHAARLKAAAIDAAGLMTAPAVTLGPDMPVARAARILARHDVKQAPVVDDDGRLAGIVARADLLRLFLRSDEEIQDEIVREVLVHDLWQDPARVRVRVRDGVVGLTGTLEARSLIPICVRLTAATEGVVDVVEDLAYDHDDTRPASYPRA